MDETLKQVLEYGIVGVVLVGCFLLVRMFIVQGLIPFFKRVSDSQAVFLDKASESIGMISGVLIEVKNATNKTAEAAERQEKVTESITELLVQHSRESAEFIRRYTEPSEFATTRTNDAIHHLARAGRAHLDGHDDETRRELDEAERAVEKR